jgi:hypothetical protein
MTSTLPLVATLIIAVLMQSQPPTPILNPTNPNPMPSDARMNQFEEPKGANW